MRKPRQPGRAMRRAVSSWARGGRSEGANVARADLLPLPYSPVPVPRQDQTKYGKAAAYAFDRCFFTGFMDAMEAQGRTGPSALGDDLYRDPAYHVATLAPGEFREEEIHLIDKATSWAPGGQG